MSDKILVIKKETTKLSFTKISDIDKNVIEIIFGIAEI